RRAAGHADRADERGGRAVPHPAAPAAAHPIASGRRHPRRRDRRGDQRGARRGRLAHCRQPGADGGALARRAGGPGGLRPAPARDRPALPHGRACGPRRGAHRQDGSGRGAGALPRGTPGGRRRGPGSWRRVGVAPGGSAVRADPLAAAHALRRDLSGRAARPGDGGRPGGRVQGGRHRDGRARWGNAPRAGGRGGATALGRPGVGPGPERRRTVPRPRPAARREGSPYQRKVGEPGAMPQFSGHWYSGRAARLVFVEAALVAIALSISGQSAHGWRELAALMAVAACVPAALYLADLYDPQIMRNDRTRGASVLKALGFAALAAAIVGLIGGGTVPRGALIEIIGVASVGVLLARAEH